MNLLGTISSLSWGSKRKCGGFMSSSALVGGSRGETMFGEVIVTSTLSSLDSESESSELCKSLSGRGV
jgi:hypothetical protein